MLEFSLKFLITVIFTLEKNIRSKNATEEKNYPSFSKSAVSYEHFIFIVIILGGFLCANTAVK